MKNNGIMEFSLIKNLVRWLFSLHRDIFFFLILLFVFVLWILVRALWHFHYKKNKKSFPSDVKEITFLVLFLIFMVVVFFPQTAECAGNNPLSEEGGSGSSSSSTNPLSQFKPSKASLDVLEEVLKKKRKNPFSPSSSLEANETLLNGYLNSMTSFLNSILVEEGYSRVDKYTVERVLFELKKDNIDPFSFYVEINVDLSKNKTESLLYKNLSSKGCFKKKG